MDTFKTELGILPSGFLPHSIGSVGVEAAISDHWVELVGVELMWVGLLIGDGLRAITETESDEQRGLAKHCTKFLLWQFQLL